MLFSGVFPARTFSHLIGDVFDPEYSIAVDSRLREMRPKGDERNVNMSLTQINNNNFTRVNNQVFLPFNGERMVAEQNFSSKFVNVNPFQVFEHRGNLILSPSFDDFL